MDRIMFYMLIFFGGGFGCLTRYFIDGNSLHAYTPGNIAACVLLGISYALYNYRIWSDNKFFHCFVNIGFLGGLSTFTPLAMFSIVQTEENMFLASGMLLGILLSYCVLCFAGYMGCNYFLKYVLKRTRQMSMLARARYLFQFKMVTADFMKIKADYEKLLALEVPLHIDSALGPLVKDRNAVKEQAMNHLRILLALTENYNESVITDKCASYGFEQMLQDAHKKGELGDITKEFFSVKDQMEYIENMVRSMTGAVRFAMENAIASGNDKGTRKTSKKRK